MSGFSSSVSHGSSAGLRKRKDFLQSRPSAHGLHLANLTGRDMMSWFSEDTPVLPCAVPRVLPEDLPQAEATPQAPQQAAMPQTLPQTETEPPPKDKPETAAAAAQTQTQTQTQPKRRQKAYPTSIIGRPYSQSYYDFLDMIRP